MNIKSLLLGSAAAMVAASAAQAADAVVYEPEPVEYVRVCDAYGAGFFYVPGTETCLAISGYVRMQVGGETWKDAGDTASYLANASGAADDTTDGYSIRTRGRVNFDARSDTEWGTLRSFVRIQGTWGTNGDGNVSFDQAFIELGGLRMGYSESAWAQTQNGGASNWGVSVSDTGMYYGYQQRHLIAYTFAGNGFAATISLEHDSDTLNAAGTALVSSADANDWIPDVVGKVSYNAGWGAVWAKAAYDSDASIVAGRQGEWAASLGMQYNIPNMNGSSLRLVGFYASDPNAYSVGSEWSVGAAYNHVFSNTFSASLGFQYLNDIDFDGNGLYDGGPDAWATELSMVWTPVQNFEVRSELAYQRADTLDGTFSGYVRFTRYF
ncbi:porin [Zhengella sp. ZM62]|uniref:porin n=1 Tax=Zhengella sedimenti TaxID=3390035 RepID=UPI003977069A